MRKLKLLLIALAAAAVVLSLMNASWLAPTPQGQMVRVANRGIAQPTEAGAGCDAARMRPSDHQYLENALGGLRRATSLGARAIAIDIQPTADGRLVAFRDLELDCRTNGSGPVAARSLAELKALDAGWGYTPDGGESFPLRGRGVGAIPSVEEVLREVGQQAIIFNFVRGEAGDADLLLAELARVRMEVDGRFGFIGGAAAERMKALAPSAWTFDRAASEACRDAYFATGWTGIMPDECRGVTVALTLERRWRNWGWPNRYLKRMADAGSRVMIVERLDERGNPVGLTDFSMLPLIPRQYNGMLWIEDMHEIGRAIR